MAKDLSRIRNIVIVMMENRSFDHMLGYLAFPEFGHPHADEIEGVPQAMVQYQNDHYFPKTLQSPVLSPDPPHERNDIQTQIAGGKMNGFVPSYANYLIGNKLLDGARIDGVMEYCTSFHVPTTDFLAKNFTICDHWFTPIPASTVPNRLFASSGYAMRDVTPDGVWQGIANFIAGKPQPLVYDWLSDPRRNPQPAWRAYFHDLAFSNQWGYPPLNFHEFSELRQDALDDRLDGVTFIEPRYEDSPSSIHGPEFAANDDHPPASIWRGQAFLKMVYEWISTSPGWERTLMVITYDEHGSFFDHVPPRDIPAAMPEHAQYVIKEGFITTGLRVPAIVISPFVKSGGVRHEIFDHTSILKLLGEKYGNDSFNSQVDARPVTSLSEVLDDGLLASTDPVAPAPRMS